MSAPAVTPLCVADDATFWPWHRWPEFSRWPDPAGTVVVLPLAGTADWGLGHALDAEETVLMHVLRAASRQRPPTLPLLVVPPLRFVLGPDPGCAFAVDPPVAHALIAEVAASIAAVGFRRLVLYNASPWNEELIAAAARDLRIAHGLQVFRVSLAGLGLDFHPVRSKDRRKLQTLITALTGRVPDPPPAVTAVIPELLAAEAVRPLAGPALPFAAAAGEGAATLEAAARHLVSLLGEIQARPALAHGGRIPAARP
jgi:creatinine amidohydrolase